MGERDIYQIVLQLKDELSSNLRAINGHLNETKKFGKATTDEVAKLETGFRKSIAPIRDFAREARNIIGMGGLAFVFRTVARDLGNMEKAYITANPAMANASGSMAAFAGAVKEVEIAIGGKINAILAPFRKWFVDLVAPVQEAKRQLDLFNAAYRELVMAYGSEEQKVAMSLVDLQKARTQQLELYNQKLKERNDLQAREKGNAAAVLAEWQSRVDAMNNIISGKSKGNAVDASQTLATLMTRKPGEFVPSEQLSGLNSILGVLSAGIATIDNYISGKQTQLDALTGAPSAGTQYGLESTQHALDVFNESMSKQAAADLTWQMSQQVTWGKELVAIESLVTIAEDTRMTMQEWQDAWNKGQEKLNSAQGLFSNPSSSVQSLLSGAASSVAGNVAGVQAGTGNTLSLGMQVAQLFGTIGTDLTAILESAIEMAPLLAIIGGIFLTFQGMIEILGPSIEGIWKPIAAVFDLLGNTVGTLLLPIFGALEPIISAICDVLSPFINLLMILEPIFKLIGDAIKIAMMPVMAIIIGIVRLANLVIDGINWAFGWAGVNIAEAPVPEMPTFHNGGVANDEMVALLQKGEIVTNPYKNTSYTVGGAQPGGIVINAPNARYLDGQTAAELVRMGLVAMRA